MLPDDPHQLELSEKLWLTRMKAEQAKDEALVKRKTIVKEQAEEAIEDAQERIAQRKAKIEKFLETGELTDDFLPEIPRQYLDKCEKAAMVEHIGRAQRSDSAESAELVEVKQYLEGRGWQMEAPSIDGSFLRITASKPMTPLDKEAVKKAAADSFDDVVAGRVGLWEKSSLPSLSMCAIWEEVGRPNWADAPRFSYVGDRLAERVADYHRRHSDRPP